MGILEVALFVSGCGGVVALHEYVLYQQDKDEQDRYDETDQYDD
jgi:hypothetical protein